jgi:hypothetical protein
MDAVVPGGFEDVLTRGRGYAGLMGSAQQTERAGVPSGQSMPARGIP